MVKADPGDYRAYLCGGGDTASTRATRGAGTTSARRCNWPRTGPTSICKVAHAVEGVSRGSRRPVRSWNKALAAAPKSVEMYLALANLEQRAGRVERAVERALELGLKAMPDELKLRLQLAMLLASRGEGDSGRLSLQIAELERIHASPQFIQYLKAYYNLNKGEFLKAKKILTSLQPDVARYADMKAMVNRLLARCYAGIGEEEQQQDATLLAYSTNPNDPGEPAGMDPDPEEPGRPRRGDPGMSGAVQGPARGPACSWRTS